MFAISWRSEWAINRENPFNRSWDSIFGPLDPFGGLKGVKGFMRGKCWIQKMFAISWRSEWAINRENPFNHSWDSIFGPLDPFGGPKGGQGGVGGQGWPPGKCFFCHEDQFKPHIAKVDFWSWGVLWSCKGVKGESQGVKKKITSGKLYEDHNKLWPIKIGSPSQKLRPRTHTQSDRIHRPYLYKKNNICDFCHYLSYAIEIGKQNICEHCSSL